MKRVNNFFLIHLFILFLFTCYTAHAQKNFVSGIVVLNSGDTLKGFISDEEWKVNPKIIYFKTTTESAFVKYTPLTTRMFRITNGNWYVSYTGLVDGSSLKIPELKYNPNPPTVLDTLFLRVLVAGNAALLYARDYRERDHFFILKTGDTIAELGYNKFLVSGYDGTHTKVNEVYRSQLVKLVADCPSLSEKIMGIPLVYNRDDFVALIKQYNSCDGAAIEYAESKERWDFGFSVLAGVNWCRLRFTSDKNTFLKTIDMDRSLGYAAGLGFNAIIPRNRKQWSIFNMVYLKNYTAYGNTELNLADAENSVYIDFHYLKLATSIRYTSPKGAVKPFIGLGMTNGYALKDKNLYTNASGSVKELIDGPKRYEFGLVAEGGLSFNHFSVIVMYESSNGMSPFQDIQSHVATLYGMVGYTF
ncbi:MAG: hypothetical protein ABIO46_11450 [Chitinophagales bacterium]